MMMMMGNQSDYMTCGEAVEGRASGSSAPSWVWPPRRPTPEFVYTYTHTATRIVCLAMVITPHTRPACDLFETPSADDKTLFVRCDTAERLDRLTRLLLDRP
jgi:hypothetical protein